MDESSGFFSSGQLFYPWLPFAQMQVHPCRRPFTTLIALLGSIILWCHTSAHAQTTNHITADELRQLRLPEVAFESVTPISPKGNNAGHLEVKGVIGDHIRFELLLPEKWNGRFAMGGGGGFVGTVQNAARDSVNRGYATVGTDTGHHSQPGYMAT